MEAREEPRRLNPRDRRRETLDALAEGDDALEVANGTELTPERALLKAIACYLRALVTTQMPTP